MTKVFTTITGMSEHIKAQFPLKKRTLCFNGDKIKPARNGWYEVVNEDSGRVSEYPRYFFNGYWYIREMKRDILFYRSSRQNWTWRGLAEEIK